MLSDIVKHFLSYIKAWLIFKDMIKFSQPFVTHISAEDLIIIILKPTNFCVIVVIKFSFTMKSRSHWKLTLLLLSVHLFVADCLSIIHAQYFTHS